MLKVLDEYTREWHVLRADRALKSGDVIRLFEEAIEQYGVPEYIRSDNGSKFIAKELQQWLAEQKIRKSTSNLPALGRTGSWNRSTDAFGMSASIASNYGP